MINKWNFQTPSEEELHKRDQLVAELGFSPVICLLLVQRGITSIEEAKKFFKPSLNDLHDPFLMPDPAHVPPAGRREERRSEVA